VDAEEVLGSVLSLVDVVHGGVVVEALSPLVSEVTEAVPL
jgi:hypothetical protein